MPFQPLVLGYGFIQSCFPRHVIFVHAHLFPPMHLHLLQSFIIVSPGLQTCFPQHLIFVHAHPFPPMHLHLLQSFFIVDPGLHTLHGRIWQFSHLLLGSVV